MADDVHVTSFPTDSLVVSDADRRRLVCLCWTTASRCGGSATATRRSSRRTTGRSGRSCCGRTGPTLRAQLAGRGARFAADAAFPIGDDLLDSHLRSFAYPPEEDNR